MRKFLILALAIGLSTSVFAKPLDSGPFPLQGGDIQPEAALNVLLTTLPDNASYTITCEIVNPKFSKQYPIVLQVFLPPATAGNNLKFIFNGNAINEGAGWYQVKLNQLTNNLEIDNFSIGPQSPSMHLTFNNRDNSDTATLQNCVATYSGNK